MKSIHTDERLRKVLHSIYVAQFAAIKKYPQAFTKADATRMLTGIMGARPWSWRVIGITHAALDLLAAHDFKRPPRQLQRGHRYDRSKTAQALYMERKEPVPIEEFFNYFLRRDKTVIMTNDENQHRPGGSFPAAYIRIPDRLGLFPCGTLVGWQHRPQEIEFLRDIYARIKR